jgi:hypothetical protein
MCTIGELLLFVGIPCRYPVRVFREVSEKNEKTTLQKCLVIVFVRLQKIYQTYCDINQQYCKLKRKNIEQI